MLQRASLTFCRLQMEGFTVLAIAKRSAFGFVCGSSTKKDIKSFCHLQIRSALCRIRLRSQQRIVTYLRATPRKYQLDVEIVKK